jgi:DNA-binding CsgD family transcriptional regulator
MRKSRGDRIIYFYLIVFVWILLLCGVCRTSIAQSPYAFCRPELIHYTRQTYNAYHQNWGVAQHRQTRFLYFANSKGLLEFDGSSWRTYELPGKQKVRSVAIDEQGRVYTGALGEFGYWSPGTSGELVYHSLADRVKEKSFQNEEIWNILITSQGILFQSFAFIYRYQKGHVQLLQPPGNILFVHQAHDKLLLEVLDKGLYALNGDRYTLIKGSEFLGRETINTILPLGDNELLIGTERAIYRYDGNLFRPFNEQLNAFIQQNRLNRGLVIGPDLYAFGTLLNGVLLTNATGQIRYHFSQKNGLQNSTVLAMCQDAEGNLWVGLDKGIDLINLNSPIRYFSDNEGDLGTPYDMAQYANNLYLGTNQGVYYKPLVRNDEPFRLISGTQGQVWDLAVIDGELLCGHNKGTFKIQGSQAQLLSSITGGWVLHRLNRHPDLLIQGTYTKLCIYQKNSQGRWAFSHTIDGFSAPVRQLEEDADGTIWVNKAPNQGLQRLRLSADLRRVVASKEYSDADFHGPAVNLCRIRQHIVVTSEKGLLAYDASSDRFISAQSIYPWLGATARKLFPVSDAALFLLGQDGTLSWMRQGASPVGDIPVKTNEWVEEYENIVPLDTNYIAVCRENGFALLPRKELPQLIGGSVRRPMIRSVSVVDGPASNYIFQGPAPLLSFSHRQANLLIAFSTPYYTRPAKYSYWLENNAETWSPFMSIHQKEFSNLPPGQYRLHLKSNLNAEESTLAFEIRPPWYWTAWSKIVYLFLMGGLVKLFYQLHLRRVAVQQNRIREKLEEKLRHQEEQSQREIILLQKEQLEQGLIQKSEELANSTMSLIQKNELLVKLKDELDRVKARSANKLSGEDFQRINTLIDANISTDQDWKLFEANFNKVHEQFLKHLIENYPDLSQGDLKLAAYLRMNLSTKEIAQLLNITHRSVELKRYRLRKKLDIEGDINLSEFMIKY